jgi:hypothetical protein
MYFLGMIGAQREHSVKALFLLNSVRHRLFLGVLLLLRKDVDYLPMAIQVYHLSNSGIRLDLVGILHSDRSIGSPHLRL